MFRSIRGVCAAAKQAPTLARAASSVPAVYELRTYGIKPEAMPSFMALTADKIGLRTAVSPLLLYGASEIGGLNEVVHLWEYPTLGERMGVRVALAGAEEWNAEYMAPMRPMLAFQTNMTLALPSAGGVAPSPTPAQGGDPEPAAPPVYELRVRSLQHGTADAWGDMFAESLDAHPRKDNLWGNFISTAGPGGESSAVEIWRYDSFDERDDACAVMGVPGSVVPSAEAKGWHNAMEDAVLFVTGESTKLILPAPFSPSQ